MKRLVSIMVVALLLVIACTRVADKQNVSVAASQNTGSEENEVLQQETTSSDLLEPVEYVAWMRNPDNGLYKEKQIDEIIYSVQYKTPDYMACISADNKDSIKPAARPENNTETIHFVDFKMTLENHEGEFLKHKLSSPAQYDSRVKYMAFGIEKDIFLVEGGDTIPCSICHFERAYDVAPEATVLLGFVSKQKYLKEKEFVFHDKLFGKGIIKFTFSKNEMKNVPRLKAYN